MDKKEMNILCATDKNFLYPTYVFMQSVMDNNTSSIINFFLSISDDITDENQNLLKHYIIQKGHNIEFIKQDLIAFDSFILSERFPKAVYFRLMAHKYLPQHLDRILYLDVDIIVDKDISDLYEMDFEDKYLIATSHNPDPSYFNTLTEHTVNYESAARGEFFNSGVLLINLDKFREDVTEDTYIKAYEKCNKDEIEVFYDQGLLNYVFFDKTKYLSSMDYNFRFSIPKTYSNRIDPKKEYKKAIIHYTGMKQPYKPWDLRFTDDIVEMFKNVPYKDEYFYISKELNDILEIWWKYAERTPVYDILFTQMSFKLKWFKRNLLEFLLNHNRLCDNYLNLLNGKKVVSTMPLNFHQRAYKLGCFLCWPYFKIKEIKNKKRQIKK